MAPRLATKYWGIIDPARLYVISREALLHDQFEAFSGDMAGMVKDLIDEEQLEIRYKKDVLEYFTPDEECLFIVKTADILEGIIFLYTEMAMGNMVVDDCAVYLQQKLRKHLNHREPMYSQLIEHAEQFLSPIRPMDKCDA